MGTFRLSLSTENMLAPAPYPIRANPRLAPVFFCFFVLFCFVLFFLVCVRGSVRRPGDRGAGFLGTRTSRHDQQERRARFNYCGCVRRGILMSVRYVVLSRDFGRCCALYGLGTLGTFYLCDLVCATRNPVVVKK